MTTRSFKVSLSGVSYDAVGGGDLPGNLPSQTALNASMAVLVADGAAPTQAHVTTANGDWTTYKASLVTALADTGGDMVVTYNDSTLNTQDKLNKAYRELGKRLGITGAN